jgi:hypothetical protein
MIEETSERYSRGKKKKREHRVLDRAVNIQGGSDSDI